MTQIKIRLSRPGLSVDIFAEDVPTAIKMASEKMLSEFLLQGSGVGVLVSCANKAWELRVQNELGAVAKSYIEGGSGRRKPAVVKEPGSVQNRQQRRAQAAKVRRAS